MIDRGIAEPAPASPGHRRGRQQLLAQLTRLLQHQPVVVLTGECGVGKYYLADQYRRLQGLAAADCWIANAQAPGQTDDLFEHLEQLVSPSGPELIVIRHIDHLSPDRQNSLADQLERPVETGPRWLLTTRVDLGRSVSPEPFQSSLFYRIRMLACPVPPLRDQKPALPGLIRELVQEYAGNYRRPVERIDESFTRAIEKHPWPGNIRELRHAVERAVIECRTGILTAEHLPLHVPTASSESAAAPPATGMLDDAVASAERLRIQQALNEHNQSRTEAARELGISRVTLYNKMKKLGIG